MTARLEYTPRIDVGHGFDAYVFRFAGLGGREVRVYDAESNNLRRKFKSTGDRDVAIINARECARVLSEEL